MKEKLCKYCDTVKPLDMFPKKGEKKSNKCLDCTREYSRQHYLNNKDKYLKRNREYAKRSVYQSATKLCKCGKEMARNSVVCRDCYYDGVRAKSKEQYERWKLGDCSVLSKSMLDYGQLPVKSSFRLFFFEDKGDSCERCGWTHDFGDGSQPPLEVSHIDHDFKNMSYDNLELLCPNCHAVESRGNTVESGNGRWSHNGYSTR